MGAGDNKVVPAAEEELFHHLGQGQAVELAVEHGFQLRVPARDGVADHDDVGRRRDVVGAEPLGQSNAAFLEKGGHGRVDVVIRAGDRELAFAQGRGHGAHGGAADPEKMKMSRRAFHHDPLHCAGEIASAGWSEVGGKRGFIAELSPAAD